MKYGSVCSGIEAASVAWEALGWKAAWLSEIEPFPSAVLANHYPSVANLGDMTKIAPYIRMGDVEAPDILVGGTPCQAFSVAGSRKGLDDARGQLTLEFVKLANAIDMRREEEHEQKCIIVWENVPGVLSSKDNAFGCFLAALAGEDDELQPPGKRWPNAGAVFGPKRAIAWRVLDAQYFGLAQRRRRVFVVASARAGFHPAQVLFEREGLRRDTPPSREAGQDAAVCPTLRAGGNSTGGDRPPGTDVDTADSLQVVSVHGTQDHDLLPDQVHPLGRNQGQENAVLAFSCKDYGADAGELAPTLRAMGHGDSHANAGGQVAVAYAIQDGAMRENPSSGPQGMGVQADIAYTLEARASMSKTQAVCVTGDISHTLKAEGFDASEDGTGRGQLIVPVAYDILGTPASEVAKCTDVHTPLRARIPGQLENSTVTMIQQSGSAVRRLTPVECERLQGFPDDWTLIPWRGKPAVECPDGPRYKAIGNSKAVPVVRWIGQRIEKAINNPWSNDL